MSTDYHAAYWAYSLSIQASPDSVDGLSRAISNARVDLNPHQVDAALFALKSPLSKGVILADEVGLGKTIEAALVISQRWAEQRRHILIVVPASLRKQWQQELWDKFFIPSVVLERRSWARLEVEGKPNPFDLDDHVVICSYYFAAKHREAVGSAPWDLAVVDEAHRLRNVYKKGNKTAKALAAALSGATKLLLTATPLQNSLMELYGLSSIIDPHLFGDPISFREQFVREPDEGLRNRLLKQRLADVCQRTLRQQVLEYVRFTERIPVTHEFYASDAEQRLYDEVSEYLRRETLYALPSAQRTLMTMVLRKLLASSSFAISGTLERLLHRLRELREQALNGSPLDLEQAVASDFETVDEIEDDWEADTPETVGEEIDLALLAEETAILEACAALAKSIRDNAKGDALLRALGQALEQAESVGAPKKAVIFTESRRTQEASLRCEAQSPPSERGSAEALQQPGQRPARPMAVRISERTGWSRDGFTVLRTGRAEWEASSTAEGSLLAIHAGAHGRRDRRGERLVRQSGGQRTPDQEVPQRSEGHRPDPRDPVAG